MRRLLPLAVSLVLAGAAAAAENPASLPFEPAIVEVRVNDEARSVTLIVRRDADGTLLIRQQDLAELRIKTPARGIVTVDGERYVRMGPEIGAQVKFDAATQSADIMLPPGAFVATRANALSPDAPVVTPPGSAASPTTTCMASRWTARPTSARSSTSACSAHGACSPARWSDAMTRR